MAALEARDAGGPAHCGRYATLGPAAGAAARRRRRGRGARGTRGHAPGLDAALAIPGLRTFGLDEAGIPAIVADGRGSSMQTNPVPLTDAELAEVLRAAL